jgi:hypothetical protein
MYGHAVAEVSKNLRRFYVYAYLRSSESIHGQKYTPYYIGKGCRDRATSKQRTIPKPSDLSCIVYVQEGLTEEEAFSLEKYCIALYGRIDNKTGILRNLSDGGDGPAGTIPSEETKRKIAEAGRGRKHTPESIRKISKAQLKDKNHMWGKTISQETRLKISNANKGLKRSDIARQNIAAGKCKYFCELIDPNGLVHQVQNLYQFSLENGLHCRLMRDLVNGKRNTYKGWTLQRVEFLR